MKTTAATFALLALLACQPASTELQAPPPQPLPVVAEGKGQFEQYPFEFRGEGDRVIAFFLSLKLPRDDRIFNGAVREVARASFKEEVYGEPELVPWKHGEQAVNGARFKGVTNWFVAVPIREGTGEVHTLIIYRVPQK